MSEIIDADLSAVAVVSSAPRRLAVDGEFTIYHVAAWKGDLSAALSRPLDLDLSAVTEIDGAGLQLLMWCNLLSSETHRAFRLISPSDAVSEALDLVHLKKFFTCVSAVGEADTTAESRYES